MRRHLLGVLLLWSATALAQARDAPPSAPLAGPSGSAQPVDPYANPSTPPAPQTNTPAPATPPPPSTNVPASPESPAPSQPSQPSQGAPAPSQQQPPPQAPQPNTVPVDAKPQPPASEQKPIPTTDKPAPAPVDQPAPPPSEKPTAGRSSGSGAGAASEPPPAATNGPRADTDSLAGATVSPAGASDAPGATTAAPRAAIVDVASAPPACRDAGSRVSSRDHNTALGSKVSFAICTASSAMASMSLVDAEASVNDLDHATANAFALLDEVAAAGDPRWQIVALHAQGDLLTQMTRRMLATVPPPGAGATQAAVQLHDSRVQLLQAHVEPWIQKAQQAFGQVDQLARANPKLASDKLVSTAIADSRGRMTNGIATR